MGNNLANQIQKKAKELDVTGYPVPISTLSQRFKDGKIKLNPKYQRVYRWTKKQKTNFIESILLRFPIPSLFFSISPDGREREIVDGQQRLTTVLEFMGLVDIGDSKKSISEGVEGTEYLSDLNGMTFNKLSKELQIDFETTSLDCKMIRKDSNPEIKFEIFKRLNSGGTNLSAQELRSCIVIMTNDSFFDFIQNLSKDKNFKKSYNFSDKQIEEQYHLELVLRYLTLVNGSDNDFKGDIGNLLDRKAVFFAKDNEFDFNLQKDIFKKTFEIICNLSGKKNLFTGNSGKKILPLYDIIAGGIGYAIKYGEMNIQTIKSNLKQIIDNIKKDSDFNNIEKAGINSISKMKTTFALGRKYFKQGK